MNKKIIIIMSVLALELSAQSITNYTTADGLLDNFVECVAVDINDNIWFGTPVGVQMFDGSSWVTYNIANYPAMASDNIKVISAMSNGDIWIGTNFGASRFDGVAWNTYTTSTIQSIPLISNQVKSIDEDPNTGIVWIGTNLGVTPLDLSGATNSLSIEYPDLHWSGVNATSFDSNGDVWFSSPLGGITHYDGINYTTYDTANGLLSQYAKDLIVDTQDNKWIGTDRGMSILNSSNTSFINYIEMYSLPPPHDSINPVVDIVIDSWGNIWTSIYVDYLGEGGLAMWDGNQWQDFHVSDGLAGPNVKGLAIDSEDNIWVATTTGVSKISSITSSISNVTSSLFEVYPNPTSGKVHINTPSNDFNAIVVYNNFGSIVYYEALKHQQKMEIDFSCLTKGLYHINLHSNKGVENHRILIN